MTEIKRVSRQELTAQEIIDVVQNGGRVVIEVSLFGKSTDVVIRYHDGIYYCDTPVTLMKHDSPEQLRDCLSRFRLTRHDTVPAADAANATT